MAPPRQTPPRPPRMGSVRFFAACALSGPAFAADEPASAPDTPQGGVELVEQLYARLDLPPHAPARPRWRRRSSGKYRVFSRPDGTVERAFEEARRKVQTEFLFDLHGVLGATVTFEDASPTTVTVHLADTQTYELASWVEVATEGVRVRAPGAVRDDGRWPLTDGSWWAWTDDATDVYTDGFRDSVLAGCGCALVERRATWLDGVPGVRFRLAHPDDLRHQWTVWAVPRDGRTWLAAAEVRADDPDVALAEARAVMATLRWAAPEADEAPR